MAIIKGMHGVCVEVAVNGVALQEYDDDEDSELDSVTKYIPANTGACFEIRWRFDRTFKHIQHPICLQVHVDGKYADAAIVSADKMPTTPLTPNKIEGRRSKAGNDWFIEKFTFSGLVIGTRLDSVTSSLFPELDLTIALDDTLPKQSHAAVAAHVATLGLISAKLYRLKTVRPKPFVLAHRLAKFDTIDRVAEKSLKGRALSHAVQ